MAKISTNKAWKPERNRKKTSQGKTKSSLKMSSMNKSSKRSHKDYKGQGR